MRSPTFIALQSVAVAPILVTLMAIIMLESGALSQAGRGEVPDGPIPRFPPPPDLRGSDAEIEPSRRRTL